MRLLLALRGHNGPETSPETINKHGRKAAERRKPILVAFELAYMPPKGILHGILNLAWKICLVFGLSVISSVQSILVVVCS